MPEWLQHPESYAPPEDKDSFVNKSILSFIGLIAHIKAQDCKPDIFKVNAFFRVLFTLMLVVFVSLSKSFAFIYPIIAYLLVLLSCMPGKDIIKILRNGLVVMLFTGVILLPTIFYGNTYSIIIIPIKVLVSLIAVSILSYATRWDHITVALKRFRLPDLFIFVLDITLKYIVMLGEFAVELLYALKLRSVGRNKQKYGSLSGVAGTLFIKSRDMAEDMYAAMECRGFTGEYNIYQKFTFRPADLLYLLINAGIIALFIILY